MHFGGSKPQITIHTGVSYTKENKPQAFASVSASNEHGPVAIWAHLEPVLNHIRTEFLNHIRPKKIFPGTVWPPDWGNPLKDGSRPLELFTQIWDETVMDLITHETNKYAWETIAAASETGICARSRLNQWVETSVSELYRLMAIFILMGICVRTRIDEYWATGILGMPSFRKLMTIDRFWLLMKFLHFVDKHLPNIRGEERKLEK